MISRYLSNLTLAKQVLWCYLIWYLCMLSIYFDSNPALWLNSAGLAMLVGYALFLSTGPGTLQRFKLRFWESLRLFICPFLVSSFASTVKGKGFILLFSSQLYDNVLGVAFCSIFLVFVQVHTFFSTTNPSINSSGLKRDNNYGNKTKISAKLSTPSTNSLGNTRTEHSHETDLFQR